MNILGLPTHDLFHVKIRSGALTVTTSPTEIKSDTTVLALRKGFILYNNSAVTMWLGDASVTTITGIPVLAGEMIQVDTGPNCSWYVTVAAATGNARVIEGY